MDLIGIKLDLPTAVLATGALGTAAFGVVEGLKWTRLGEMGFSKITETLGTRILNALENAYGPQSLVLLRAQYSSGRAKGDLTRTLRQGVRIGLTTDNARGLATEVGVVDAGRLVEVVRRVQAGEALEDADKSVLGRFELAVDARIDAALGLAERSYLAGVRNAAYGIAILLSCLTASAIWFGESDKTPGRFWGLMFWALLLGVAAVPIAPIAKDISNGIQAAAKVLRAKT